MDLMTMAEIGRLLGVSRQQVWVWHDRRRRNGFPEAAAMVERTLGAPTRAWRQRDVDAWHASYVPALGGRPRSRTEQVCQPEPAGANRL